MNNVHRSENPEGPVIEKASGKIMDPRRDVVAPRENKSDHRVEAGLGVTEVGPMIYEHLAVSVRKSIIHYS